MLSNKNDAIADNAVAVAMAETTSTNLVVHHNSPSPIVLDTITGIEMLSNLSDAQKNELLFTLLMKVNSLTSTTLALESTNQELTQRLAVAEQEIILSCLNNGGRFHFFKKLPKEVQIMIWKWACYIPQTHVLSGDGASRSQILNIAESCMTALEAVLELELDYFLVTKHSYATRGNKTDVTIPGTVRNFFNVDIDTFYTVGRGADNYMPECIQWVCGSCHDLRGGMNENSCDYACLSDRSQSQMGPEGMFRLIFDLLDWEDMDHGEFYGTIATIERNEPEELWLVLRDPGVWNKDADVVFLKPQMSPREVYHDWDAKEIGKEHNGGWNRFKSHIPPKDPVTGSWLGIREATWGEVEKGFEGYIQQAIDDREAHRQSLVDAGVTWEEVNRDHSAESLKHVTIPKIRIVEVEARAKLRDWVPLEFTRAERS